MRHSSVLLSGLGCALAMVSGASVAQTSFDFGKNEYQASCASCHGVTAKGDGAVSRFLMKAPSDLTMMAKRNGGAFPYQYAWEVIDGRKSAEIGVHGSRDMPVWGYIYRSEDTQPADLHARNRIGSLLDYLVRIQVK
ncbi:MAG TPA: cytochrome c [Rhodoferax sp.]|nr:cytochrome c [Rhodoferax sp.]